MKKANKYYFEKLYKENKDFLWGFKPNSLTIKLLKLLPKHSKVLDLGCGEGKDALFLAKKGHEVTAIDISESAIKKLKKRARKGKIKIKALIADLEKYKINEDYDAMIALASIHFLRKKQIIKLIKTMKERTKKGGINIIIVFRKKDSSEKSFKMYYFNDGELKKYYSDWKIISYREYLKKDKHNKEDKVHYHRNADIIAQKVN